MTGPSEEDLKVLEYLEGLVEAEKFNKLSLYKPYVKQKAFHDAGATHWERAIIAGNRTGKTEAGSYEIAYHATGLYPDWWQGRRFTKPVVGWVAGETGLAVRDTVQQKLLGPPGVVADQGSGSIPRHLIVDVSLARGITDLVDTIQVKHVSGGVSTVKQMTYEMGRSRWQGATLDFIWFDEEPPEDIYQEGITRRATTNGMVFCTFTPLQGMSSVVERYMSEEKPWRTFFTVALDEVGHFTPQMIEETVSAWAPHEREARRKGIPLLGSGQIFPTPEEMVVCEPTEIKKHWAVLGGLDIGMDHPTACVWIAWDRDVDVIYVYHEHRATDYKIAMHASAMRARGHMIPWAWPHDGNVRDKGSGETIASLFKKEGVNMLHSHATWPEGGYSTDAAIMEIQNREETGRLKYFSNCVNILGERRLYHRKDGLIVKEKDDLLSALQKCIMMKRYARPYGDVMARGLGKKKPQKFAAGVGRLSLRG